MQDLLLSLPLTFQKALTSTTQRHVLMQELMQDLLLSLLLICQKAPTFITQKHALMLVLSLVSLENLTHLLSVPSVEP